MNILILGGFGYLGASIAKYLYQVGNKITVAGRSKPKESCLMPGIEVLKVDLMCQSQLEDACKNKDVVIHAAGLNQTECELDPTKGLIINGLYTANSVEAAIKQQVSRFIYLSTAHVYSNRLEGNFDEETCALNLHPYATSHKAGEDYLRNAISQNKIEGAVVRLSNVFGAPVSTNQNCWHLVMNEFAKRAINEKKILIYSNAAQYRDFIPMSIFMKRIYEVISYKDYKKNIVNVGSHYSMTLLEAAKIIQDRVNNKFGYKPEIEYNLFHECKELNYLSNYNKSANKEFALKSIINEVDNLLSYCKSQIS